MRQLSNSTTPVDANQKGFVGSFALDDFVEKQCDQIRASHTGLSAVIPTIPRYLVLKTFAVLIYNH